MPPFPRSFKGKLHILLAHARQLHLTTHLLWPGAPKYDVYFVDQLSTCIPLLRALGHTRVLFYCHFPDKLLADGAYIEGRPGKAKAGLLKTVYRFPMDWLEETTTRASYYLSYFHIGRLTDYASFRPSRCNPCELKVHRKGFQSSLLVHTNDTQGRIPGHQYLCVRDWRSAGYVGSRHPGGHIVGLSKT